MFCKKDVLENFAKFKGKYLCHNLFLNKDAVLMPALWDNCFPVNFVNFLRTSFFIEHQPRLLKILERYLEI